jgi:hypothetical protein
MTDRIEKIKQLIQQKEQVDAELKTLKEAIKAETAAIKAPRKPRKKADG